MEMDRETDKCTFLEHFTPSPKTLQLKSFNVGVYNNLKRERREQGVK